MEAEQVAAQKAALKAELKEEMRKANLKAFSTRELDYEVLNIKAEETRTMHEFTAEQWAEFQSIEALYNTDRQAYV